MWVKPNMASELDEALRKPNQMWRSEGGHNKCKRQTRETHYFYTRENQNHNNKANKKNGT